MRETLKIHDTCSVLSLHGFTGLISAILGAIFASVANYDDATLYKYYPARAPRESVNGTGLDGVTFRTTTGLGRSAGEQAGFQIAALSVTIGLAVVFGLATGFILRLPIFEKLSEELEMFDDEAQWVTPDDYALKLTFASSNRAQQQTAVNETDKSDNNQDSKA